MKIQAISIENYGGAKRIEAQTPATINLFAGLNATGKSSIHDAISVALIGESQRVEARSDWPAVVTAGAKRGVISLLLEGGQTIKVSVPTTSKFREAASPFLRYVIHPAEFASIGADGRRAVLFELTGIASDRETVRKGLLDRHCDPAKVEPALELIRGGWDVAMREAQASAREARAVWKAITGEVYGEIKAGSWTAPVPDSVPDIAELEAAHKAAVDEAEQIAKGLGEVEQTNREAARIKLRIEFLTEGAERAGSVQKYVERLESDREELREKLQGLKRRSGPRPKAAKPLACPECGALLQIAKDGSLLHVGQMELQPPAEDDEDLAIDIEAGIAKLTTAIVNAHRDLTSAKASQQERDELLRTGYDEADEAAVKQMQDALAAARKREEKARQAIGAAEAADLARKYAAEKTGAAKRAHHDVIDWMQIAEALGPSGIRADLLAAALSPVNKALAEEATAAGWPAPVIGDDMSIRSGSLPYSMLSESEKWRVDALVAAMFARLSDLRFMALDRFDVLDVPNRVKAIRWLARDAERYGSVFLFGTLKARPSGLPALMACHWVEGGELIEETKAEAGA